MLIVINVLYRIGESTLNGYTNELFNLLLYSGIVLFLAGVIIVLSFVLGERHSGKLTGEPYESGIAPSGNARLRFSGKFYIVAMFFVIFDLEAVFFAAWAIAFKEAGWSGYIGILIFVLLLVTVLIYEWRMGALNFAQSGREIIKAIKKSEQ
jgi:NADH-quinone oxidoreductase subunit A